MRQNNSQIVVVGFGNEFRQDDGVGLYIARLMREKLPDDVKVVDGIPDGYALLETWDNTSRVFVIDCAVSGKTPGTIFRFDALNEEIPADLFDGFSTHSISLVDAIEMAKVMDRLPRSMIVYGIEGKDYSAGDGLSPELKPAADRLAENILNDIGTSIDNM